MILPSGRGLIYLLDTPEDNPLTVEMQQRLTRAILDLPDPERLVFTLFYYEKLTKREIGLLLGETESYVSQIHASALSHLHSGFADPIIDFPESSGFFDLLSQRASAALREAIQGQPKAHRDRQVFVAQFLDHVRNIPGATRAKAHGRVGGRPRTEHDPRTMAKLESMRRDGAPFG